MKDMPASERAGHGGRTGPAMWLLDRMLHRLIVRGDLTIVDADGHRRSFGTPSPGFPNVTLRFHDRGVPRAIVRSPGLGLAEAFMDGRATMERGDIWALLMLVYMNNPLESAHGFDSEGLVARLRSGIGRSLRQLNRPGRSRRNVAHHYDLDSRLYALFLDSDLQYSCAYFPHPDYDLEAAQMAKKAHIAAKLRLRAGQHVLDIGCGWGGMALYLHRHYGVRVTGITLSSEQLAVARRRASEAGVAHAVRFELQDYREIAGPFDRIVSVGMFEHVGAPQYRAFFRQCRNLLAPDGIMLLHTIGRIGGPGATDAFTRKYIFPGGYIPALSELSRAVEDNGLFMTDVETLRLHYARTLRLWYERTVARQSEIEALYDARFFRMWTFYLAGAAMAFEYGGLVNYQVQITRDRRALPLTRDYMRVEERRLTAEPAPPEGGTGDRRTARDPIRI